MSNTEQKSTWYTSANDDANDVPMCNGSCLLLTPDEIAEQELEAQYQSIGSKKSEYTGEKRWHVVGETIERLTDHSLLSFSGLYQPLLPTQTRLIIVPPESSTKLEHKISLVTVDLISSQGLRLADTLEIVEYTALSYSWRDLRLTKQIHCNDLPIHIPLNLLAAIQHHQKKDSSTFLWVDAICINQDDAQEKATQVMMMMDIYLKAQSVTAWLGLPDKACQKAIDYIKDADRLKAQLAISEHTVHTPACHNAIQTYFTTLLSLYEQPYLSRTWIRQETFAGKNIMVVCGRTKLRWQYYVWLGQYILFHLTAIVDPKNITLRARYSAMNVLLEEAQLTSEAPASIRPAFRKLSEVLLRSQYFGVTEESDTVFASLSMCGVQSTINRGWKPSDRAFLVDYTRSSDQVYHDLSMWMINHDQAAFLSAWTYCVKQNNKSLPSWVIDWRNSPSNDTDIAALDKIKEHHLHGVYEWFPPSAKLPEFCNTLTLSESDSGVVTLLAQVTNHVAFVTDFACPVDQLIDLAQKAKNTLDADDFHEILSKLSLPQFDAAKHDRRIAILGFAQDTQVALVPASTRVGDLVVAINPRTFPMIIRPSFNDSSNFSREFIPQMDECSWPIATPAIRRRQRLVVLVAYFLCLTVFALIWPVLASKNHYRLVLIRDSDLSREAVFWMVSIGLFVVLIVVLFTLCNMAAREGRELLEKNIAKLDCFTDKHDSSCQFVGPALVDHGNRLLEFTRIDAKSKKLRADVKDISLAARPWQKFLLH